MSIASQGTVLAQARTRPFDVFAHENYVAPRKYLGSVLILLVDPFPNSHNTFNAELSATGRANSYLHPE